MIPLFEHYPPLEDKLPYVPLGEFQTAIEKLNNLGADIGVDNRYIKREDLAGTVYGGNR